MKQTDLFGSEPQINSTYTAKIEAPLYEPKNAPPHILELVDDSKTKRLITEIKNSKISEPEKAFLIEAAKRHNVFDYARIADYYAHAGAEMQELMENSALVIIDFEKAIQLGFVKLSTEIFQQYLTETKDEK